MRNRISLFILVAAASLAAAPSPAAAQSAEAEIEAVVLRLFDGMRSGDSAVVRSAFHPEARLQSVGERDGAVTLRSESVDGFVRAVGTPHPEPWDERIANLEVRVDGDLATAWMDYAFYLGPRFSHCGGQRIPVPAHRGRLAGDPDRRHPPTRSVRAGARAIEEFRRVSREDAKSAKKFRILACFASWREIIPVVGHVAPPTDPADRSCLAHSCGPSVSSPVPR
jgi:hypothetical protein